MKKLPLDNCPISGYELKNIDQVKLKAQPYTKTAITIVAKGYATETDWLWSLPGSTANRQRSKIFST